MAGVSRVVRGTESERASVVLEGLALGLVGSIIAVVISYLVFNGFQTSASANGAMAGFSFSVTPSLVDTALILALIMGFIGSLFPAICAARLLIAWALREA